MGDPRLLLFDIDQTLVHTAGAGMRSMARAVADLTGLDLLALPIRPDGKTDPQILAEAFAYATNPGQADDAALQEEVWRRYAAHLADELDRPDARRALKPGVQALLEALEADDEAFLGLLTGNLETTAHLKLRAFGIDGFFPVGAFGSDCLDRCRLGAVALERARAFYGFPFEDAHVWVVGDTDRDIEAGRAIGPRARVLAVATGRQSVDELAAFRPDRVLPDLSDTAQVLSLLLD